jgi:hypothetical protein
MTPYKPPRLFIALPGAEGLEKETNESDRSERRRPGSR